MPRKKIHAQYYPKDKQLIDAYDDSAEKSIHMDRNKSKKWLKRFNEEWKQRVIDEVGVKDKLSRMNTSILLHLQQCAAKLARPIEWRAYKVDE